MFAIRHSIAAEAGASGVAGLRSVRSRGIIMAMTTSTVPSVAEMLHGFSIEVNPKETKIIDACPARLEPGTEVFLTWIPGEDPMNTVPAAAQLRRAGLFPVPHVGARHVESEVQLGDFAARLAAAGVDRVLCIAGDRDKPAGPYDASLQVMQSGLLQKNGITRIAVGAFPEGNPNIPDPVLAEALTAKVNFARETGLRLSIVTQFCFQTEPIVEWLRATRGQGIDLPVRVGLAGPAGIIALTRYAMKCGVGNSIKVLTEKPSFAKLLIDKGPEPLIRQLAEAVAQGNAGGAPGIQGLHFFVFGGFNKTVDWINAQKSQ
jgi:methylenetetrahydrofolate reductase (NADPH)